MIQLPSSVAKIIVSVQKDMYLHPSYQIIASQRSQIYKNLPAKAIGWLGVLTSELSLPIFYDSFDNTYIKTLISEDNQDLLESLPQNLIFLAKQVLEEQIHITQVEETLHVAEDIQWIYAKKSVPNNALWAANSAVRALGESCGILPLQNLELYHSRQGATGWVSGNTWSNDLLANVGGDAASASLAALASDTNYSNPPLPNFDVSKIKEFWEWWLTEAIPKAWELGEQSFKNSK